MRLTGLFAGREALMAQGSAINVVADNLANFNTPGFKAQRSEFGDLLADSEGSLFGSQADTGNGLQLQEIRVLHEKQGTIDFTDRSTDAAIQGDGFFNVSNGTDTFYTRAGDFSIDQDGNLVTNDGLKVLGYPSTATPTDPTTGTAATPAVLNVNSVSGTATPSTTAAIGGNLNTDAPLAVIPADQTTFKSIASTADFSAPVRVIDSLGKSHDVSLYFYHDTNLTYTVNAYVDSADTGPAGTVGGAPVSVGTGTVTFGTDGNQAAGAAATMNLTATWGNGAAPSSVALDLSGLTGFAGSSNLNKTQVNGNPAGSPVGYSIDKDGTFNVVLDSGANAKVGQIVLSTFVNDNGLERVGKNNFRAGDETGTITTGAASTEGRGEIDGGALENSTVDPAAQFIDLVRYQRGYQAGSQVIQTISQLLSTTIGIAG